MLLFARCWWRYLNSKIWDNIQNFVASIKTR